jgi:hypothetical protein
MATNPTVTEATPDIQPVNMDWTVVVKRTKNDDGTVDEYLSASQDMKESEIQKHKEAGTWKGTQTFAAEQPLTDKGFAELLPEQEQRNACTWAGLRSSLLGPRIRRMLEQSRRNEETKEIECLYEFTAEAAPTRELIREDAKRRNLSPEEKIIKNLSAIPGFENLPREVLLNMYQSMRASLPSAMVADIEAPAEEQVAPA